MKNLILILLIIFSKFLFGSTIYHKNFDLHKYDLYDNIYEIEIIDTLPSDTLNIDFLPLLERISLSYKIRVISYFKGKTLINDTVFNKDAFWKLNLGETYIIYNSYSLNRDIQYKHEDYNKEIENLKKLSLKKGYITLDNGRKKIAEGKFKNKKRHGVWKLYYEVPSHFTSDNESIVYLELHYKKGELVQIVKNVNEFYLSNNETFNVEMERFYFLKLSLKEKIKYNNEYHIGYQFE